MKKVKSGSLILKVPCREAENLLKKQILNGKEFLSIPIKTIAQWKAVEKQYNHWNSENFELLKKILKKRDIARDYSASPWSIGRILVTDLKLNEKIENLHNCISRKLVNLESIKASLELLDISDEASSTVPANMVFFVHGTDCDTKIEVLDFLQQLGLQPIILKEFAAAGKTIIDEIKKRDDVKYAIALLTPDHVGAVYNQELNFRASQNVILELGVFVGKLGRKRVSGLCVDDIELPADYHGFEYIKMDRYNDWHLILAKELKEAGFEIDLNAI